MWDRLKETIVFEDQGHHENKFLKDIFFERAQIMKVVEWVFIGQGKAVLEWIVMKKTQIRKNMETGKLWKSKLAKKQHKWDVKMFQQSQCSAEPIAWFVMTEKLRKFVRKRKI